MMMHAARFRVVPKAPQAQRVGHKTKPRPHQRMIIINDSSKQRASKANEAIKTHENMHESSGMPDNSIPCGLTGCARSFCIRLLSVYMFIT